MRSKAPLLCLVTAACVEGPPAKIANADPVPSTSASVLIVPSASPAPPATARAAVVELSVADATKLWGFGTVEQTRVLYTWTTDEQLAALRKGEPVLQRSFSPKKGFATFDHALHERATRGDATAKVLWHEGFAKSRFAWTNAFGVAAALKGENYGGVLLRIVLKREAVLVRMRSGDASNPEAPADAKRIASVEFHARRYREYVIMNESMIERVDAFTPELRADVERQVLFLRGLLARSEPAPPYELSAFFPDLEKPMAPDDIQASLRALESLLARTDAPFERAPTAPFVLGAPRLPIDVLCKKLGVETRSMGTFGISHVAKCAPETMCTPVSSRTPQTTACAVSPMFLQ